MEIIHSRLTDGVPICIRRVRPDDGPRLKAGIALMSSQSRYFRFFSGLREAPPQVLERLLDVDGHDHIAWGALRTDLPDTPALGVVHAFRDEADPQDAEFSVAVIDEYHGRGLARMLTLVLLLDCRREGLERLSVNVLAENLAARAFVRSLGAEWRGREMEVFAFEVDIASAIATLKAEPDLPGLLPIFAHFGE